MAEMSEYSKRVMEEYEAKKAKTSAATSAWIDRQQSTTKLRPNTDFDGGVKAQAEQQAIFKQEDLAAIAKDKQIAAVVSKDAITANVEAQAILKGDLISSSGATTRSMKPIASMDDALGGMTKMRFTAERIAGSTEAFIATNIGTIDLDKLIVAPGTLNSPTNAAKTGLEEIDIKDLLKKADSNINSAIDNVKDIKGAIDAKSREVKGLFAKARDIASLPGKILDQKLGGLFPKNSPLSQMFTSGINKNCTNQSLKYNGLGKPYDLKVDCAGGKNKTTSKCNNGQFSDLLNKLTGGAYGNALTNLNDTLASLTALSGYGYELNMCGVFSALSAGIDNKDLIGRSAGGLANMLSGAKNAIGLFDLSKSAANVGLHVPGIAGIAMAGFAIPKTLSEGLLPNFAERGIGALDLFASGWDSRPGDTRWDKKEDDGSIKDIYSIGSVKASYESSFGKAFMNPDDIPSDAGYQPSFVDRSQYEVSFGKSLTAYTSDNSYTDADCYKIPDPKLALLTGGLGAGKPMLGEVDLNESFSSRPSSISVFGANGSSDEFERNISKHNDDPSTSILPWSNKTTANDPNLAFSDFA